MNLITRIFLSICAIVFLYVYWGGGDLLVLFLVLRTLDYRIILSYFALAFIIVKLPIPRLRLYQRFWDRFLRMWLSKTSISIHPTFQESLDTPLPQRRKTLVCYAPHGIVPLAPWLFGMSYRGFSPGLRMLVHPSVLKFPIVSILARLHGCVSCDSSSMNSIMSTSNSDDKLLGLVPGGADEMLFTEIGSHTLYLHPRKGFIKYALRHGYDIVPCFTFGETEMYYSRTLASMLSTKSSTSRYISVHFFLLFHYLFVRGWMWLTVMPRRDVGLFSFFGEVIRVDQRGCEEPKREVVEEFHRRYVEAICRTRAEGIEVMEESPEEFEGVNKGKLLLI